MPERRESPLSSGVNRSGLHRLAGIGFTAEAVHGDGKGFVRFF